MDNRDHVRRCRSGIAVAAGLLALLAPGPAQGDELALTPEIDVQHFQPVEDGYGWFATRSATLLDRGRFAFGAWWSHADDPMVFVADDGERTSLVGDLMTLDLQGAIGLGAADVALDLPLHLRVAGDGLGSSSAPFEVTAIGDLRLVPKVRLLGGERHGGFGLGLGVPLTLPTGDEQHFVGARTLSITPTVLLTGDLGRLQVGGNLGVRLAGAEPVGRYTLGGAMFHFAAAASVYPAQFVGISAELFGDVRGVDNANPVEWLAGVVVRPAPGVILRVGGGSALGHGTGAPVGRVLFGATFQPPPRSAPATEPPATVAQSGVEDPPVAPEPELRTLEVICPQADWIRLPHPFCAKVAMNDGKAELQIPQGVGHLTVGGAGYLSRTLDIDGLSDPNRVAIDLQPEPDRGWIRVSVYHRGDPVADAQVQLGAQGPVTATTGRTSAETPAGPVTVAVRHPDYRDEEFSSIVTAESCTFVRVELSLAPVWFPERVYFDVGRTELRGEADPVLRAVAERALARPDAGTLTIVGMADPRGDAALNRELCRGRGEAVKARLLELGVPAQRLDTTIEPPRGDDDGADEEALQNMRRVEFRLEMDDGKETP